MTRVLTTLGIALLALSAASCNGYEADESDGPDQPIAFYHSVHAGQNQIPCQYCHFSADRSPDAGLPSTQVCAGCHIPGATAAGADPAQAVLGFPSAQRNAFWNAEANKMVGYWKNQQSIPWTRIHRIPEHAKFPHNVHVNVGLQCQTCHGPVQEMQKVYQFSSLRMGWCIDCHRGKTELSAAEDSAVRQRSTFVRKVASLRAAGVDTRGQPATWPHQRASTDCVVCHY